MKVAVVYDDLKQRGGGEIFLNNILKVVGNCTFYTPIYSHQDSFCKKVVYSKPLTFLAKSLGKIGYYSASLLSVYWFENQRFEKFDIVINLSNRNSISIITPTNTTCINIITTPFRLLWEKSPNLFMNAFLNPLRCSNFIYSRRSDYTFTISSYARDKIKKYWGIDSKIIRCPYKKLLPVKPKEPVKFDQYFLMGGRFNRWKGKYFLQVLDYFSKNPQYNLICFGKVSSNKFKINTYKKYKNIYFVGRVSDNKLSNLYKNCLAFIHPQVEDFGLTPFEALQFYKPIIALNKGGVCDYLNTNISILYKDFNDFELAIKKSFDYKIDRERVNKILDLYSFENFEYNFKKLLKKYAQKTNG